MKLQEEKVYEEDKKIFGIYERRKRNRGRGDDIDIGRKFHPVFGVCIVWIEWKCVDKSY
jgi:hypothetical protein